MEGLELNLRYAWEGEPLSLLTFHVFLVEIFVDPACAPSAWRMAHAARRAPAPA